MPHIVKAKSSGEDPKAIEGLVSNLPHPRVNKTKQHMIWPPIPKTIFIKHCRVEIIAFPFVLFLRDRFSKFYCLFRQRFSAAYLLKVSLLPKRVHTTLFIRCDQPELTRWCLCSLHAGIQYFEWHSVSQTASSVSPTCPFSWQFYYNCGCCDCVGCLFHVTVPGSSSGSTCCLWKWKTVLWILLDESKLVNIPIK